MVDGDIDLLIDVGKVFAYSRIPLEDDRSKCAGSGKRARKPAEGKQTKEKQLETLQATLQSQQFQLTASSPNDEVPISFIQKVNLLQQMTAVQAMAMLSLDELLKIVAIASASPAAFDEALKILPKFWMDKMLQLLDEPRTTGVREAASDEQLARIARAREAFSTSTSPSPRVSSPLATLSSPKGRGSWPWRRT